MKSEGKTLVIKGEPGTGKTHFVMAYLHESGMKPVIINDFNSIKDFMMGVNDCIVVDDMDFSKLSREVVLKLVDSSLESTFK
jgi:KaiC/GvpD/RAD55 family RecA-like ATPase